MYNGNHVQCTQGIKKDYIFCFSHWPLRQTDHSKCPCQICFGKHTWTAGYLSGKSVVLYTNAAVWMLHVPTAPFHRWSTCLSRLFPLPEPCLETLTAQSGPLFFKTAVCLQAPQKHNANKSTLWRALTPGYTQGTDVSSKNKVRSEVELVLYRWVY